jgi:hypothetical protein
MKGITVHADKNTHDFRFSLKTNDFDTENFRTPTKQRSYRHTKRQKAPKSSKFPPKSAQKRHFGLGFLPLSPLVPKPWSLPQVFVAGLVIQLS